MLAPYFPRLHDSPPENVPRPTPKHLVRQNADLATRPGLPLNASEQPQMLTHTVGAKPVPAKNTCFLPPETTNLPQNRTSFPQNRINFPQNQSGFPQNRVSFPQNRTNLPQNRSGFPQKTKNPTQETQVSGKVKSVKTLKISDLERIRPFCPLGSIPEGSGMKS